MAKETMAEKAKKQKASKVSGLYEGVGKFKGKKSLNLRDKQLGKKGVAASKKRTVSISNTSYDKKTKIVTGPKGNALTGKVDMGGGNMAVYRNGKRVTAAKKAPAKPTGNGGGGGTGGKTGLTRGQKAQSARYTGLANSPNKGARQTGGTTKKTPPKTFAGSSIVKTPSKTGSSGKNWWNTPVKDHVKGPFVTGPKRLDKRRGPKGMEIYNGSKWILMK